MSSNSERIVGLRGLELCNPIRANLYDAAAIRSLEQFASRLLPPGVLMERAGLAVAKLALALNPHASNFWVACGPGNNGGDGYIAARHLHQWGKTVAVSCLFDTKETQLPVDAMAALESARQAQVKFVSTPPEQLDVCIDAIFGIGQLRASGGNCGQGIEQINSSNAFRLSVDVPSGLDASTGEAKQPCVNAHATLTLLGMKPGLFTGDGRDHCGEIWLNDLDVENAPAPTAYLNQKTPPAQRRHNTHKGTYGDVSVIGGSRGMTGAAILAATAALNSGAGRVSVGLLDSSRYSLPPPDLMMREISELAIANTTLVAGCGGGAAISSWMAEILQLAERLVLDADALNAIANSSELCGLLSRRRHDTTVLTPHPLEAARLLACSTNEIQSNRLKAAQTLATRFNCTVVLKGSGTVIASPVHIPHINPSGNARLATAGTGDVLAGMIGAHMAAGEPSFVAACSAAFHHGAIANRWTAAHPLTARALCDAL